VSAEEVAARVNGVPITEAQVREASVRIASSQETENPSPEATHQEALQSLVDIQVLTQQAKVEKIEVSAEEIDRAFNSIKSRYPSPDAFQKALTTNNATETTLRKEIGDGLIMQKLVDRHVSVQLAADAAEQFYKGNLDKFHRPAEVRASHILFRLAEGGDEKAVRQRAQTALERIKKGEDFGKLAKELSEDPGSAQQDGDLGYFARGTMVTPFDDAVFALKKGEVSGIVQTQFGFHIIKLTDTREAGVVPLAEAKADIEAYLQQQERNQREHAYLDELKKTIKIEIVEPAKVAPAAAK
jgi:peptidyl-prolyl cis-trans isomerase C